MKKIKTLAILNFVVFTAACLISNLSQLKIIGNKDMAEVSKKYDTVFAPAGITFAIWGVIYLSLFGFTIYHLIKAFKQDELSEANQDLKKISYLFVINNVATAIWVFAFLNEWLGLSVVLIVTQLISLLLIFIRLDLFDNSKSLMNKIFTQFPLSIYFAWICVATIANISAYLVSIGWKGPQMMSDIDWATLLISIATLIALFIIGKKKNPYFGLVIIWALYGIQIKRAAINEVEFASIIKLCWMGMGFLALTTVLEFYKNSRKKKDEIPS